jgi:hypothetical protein
MRLFCFPVSTRPLYGEWGVLGLEMERFVFTHLNGLDDSNTNHPLLPDSGGFQPGNSTTTASIDSFQNSNLAGTDGSFTLEALINIPNLTVKRESSQQTAVSPTAAFSFTPTQMDR